MWQNPKEQVSSHPLMRTRAVDSEELNVWKIHFPQIISYMYENVTDYTYSHEFRPALVKQDISTKLTHC